MGKLNIDLITLGNELLLGIRHNAHVAYIGNQLGLVGLHLRRAITTGDVDEDIQRDLRCCLKNDADVIIFTGGLGPTMDDNARDAVAKELGLPLNFDESIKEAIAARFAQTGAAMTENTLRQCYLPEGAEIIPNPYGTAQGLFLEHQGTLIFMLPGPVSELQPMLCDQVIPRLCSKGYCNYGDAYLQIRTSGIGESMLETRLLPILAENPKIDVAFCAHQGLVDVRLSSQDPEVSASDLRRLGNRCREFLGPDFCCFGDHSLAKVVYDHLRASETTLSVAESCTGGLLGNAFTDIPGASKVFSGGVVCYNNDAKIDMLGVPEAILSQHGAVSGECAAAMADCAAERFGTDYALSVTGFAGPDGGTPGNPVGTIYIGYHSPIGTWCVKMVKPGARMQIKTRAVNKALDVMRRKLQKYQVQDAIATMAAS